MELLNTELDAINLCLSGIGREPVSSIDTADLDAAMARSVLQQMSHDIQINGGRGWWFNEEKGWKLQPDNKGEIYLPNNTISILESRGTFYDVGNRLTIRGRRVYDTNDHTFDMRNNVGKDGKIEFILLLILAYDEMPPTARSAVAWAARRVFSDDTIGDMNMHQVNVQNEQRAFAHLEMENRRTLRTNYLRDNQMIRGRLGRIQGYNNMYQ